MDAEVVVVVVAAADGEDPATVLLVPGDPTDVEAALPPIPEADEGPAPVAEADRSHGFAGDALVLFISIPISIRYYVYTYKRKNKSACSYSMRLNTHKKI